MLRLLRKKSEKNSSPFFSNMVRVRAFNLFRPLIGTIKPYNFYCKHFWLRSFHSNISGVPLLLWEFTLTVRHCRTNLLLWPHLEDFDDSAAAAGGLPVFTDDLLDEGWLFSESLGNWCWREDFLDPWGVPLLWPGSNSGNETGWLWGGSEDFRDLTRALLSCGKKNHPWFDFNFWSVSMLLHT